MPMPFTYRHATDEWRRFLATMRERTLIESDNVIYQAVEGLFRSFRARIPAQQVLEFGDQLPCIMRAILTADWDLSEPMRPWTTRDDIEAEIRSLRVNHNIIPRGILDDLIPGIRTEVRAIDFDRVLSRMAPQAQALWTPQDAAATIRG